MSKSILPKLTRLTNTTHATGLKKLEHFAPNSQSASLAQKFQLVRSSLKEKELSICGSSRCLGLGGLTTNRLFSSTPSGTGSGSGSGSDDSSKKEGKILNSYFDKMTVEMKLEEQKKTDSTESVDILGSLMPNQVSVPPPQSAPPPVLTAETDVNLIADEKGLLRGKIIERKKLYGSSIRLTPADPERKTKDMNKDQAASSPRNILDVTAGSAGLKEKENHTEEDGGKIKKAASGTKKACAKLSSSSPAAGTKESLNLRRKPSKSKGSSVTTKEKENKGRTEKGTKGDRNKKADSSQSKSAIKDSDTSKAQSKASTSSVHTPKKSKSRDKYQMEELSAQDCQRRVMFATKLLLIIEDEPEILDNILWTDECNFNLPRVSQAKQVPQSDELPQIAWCGITTKGAIGPYFFNSHVTDKSYLKMLKNFVLPELECKGYNLKELWFQQDGAPWHRSKEVLDFLRSVFDYRIISLGTKFIWPPRSQDLTPMDYFFWDYMKLKINFKHSKYDLQYQSAFREILAKEVVTANRKTLQGAIYQIPDRLELCINCNGGRFQHLMYPDGKLKEDVKLKKENNQKTKDKNTKPAKAAEKAEIKKEKVAAKSTVPPSRFKVSKADANGNDVKPEPKLQTSKVAATATPKNVKSVVTPAGSKKSSVTAVEATPITTTGETSKTSVLLQELKILASKVTGSLTAATSSSKHPAPMTPISATATAPKASSPQKQELKAPASKAKGNPTVLSPTSKSKSTPAPAPSKPTPTPAATATPKASGSQQKSKTPPPSKTTGSLLSRLNPNLLLRKMTKANTPQNNKDNSESVSSTAKPPAPKSSKSK